LRVAAAPAGDAAPAPDPMKLHRLDAVLRLPVPVEEAWGFFSDAGNLAAITPPSLGLEVTSPLHAGMIVTYRVRPLLGVPVTWVTEITHVDEGRMFVDEQRFGPYRFWHHQHHFAPAEGGVEMRDVVHYALPAGAGPLRALLVAPRLDEIFAHRARVLTERFGAPA
jgi:ligand-binding SRPBCC domain-containing protein